MSETPTRRPTEPAFAIVLLIFSVAAVWQAHGIAGEFSFTGPGAFPLMAASAMTMASVVIVIRAFLINPPTVHFIRGLKHFFNDILPLRHVIMIILIALYLFSMTRLGFMLSSAWFLAITFTYLWRKNVFVTLGVTAISLFVIYVVFRTVFQVVLPQGNILTGWF